MHATICSNNVAPASPNNSAAAASLNTPTKVLQNYNNRAIRARHKSNEHPATIVIASATTTASPQVQGYTKLNSTHQHTKLNTTMLSQLNPHLTPEQKFSRTINHVEKWLTERDQVLTKTNNTEQRVIKFGEDSKLKMKEIAKDEKNLDNLINTKMFVDKLKMTEKFTEKFTESPTKKTFNKEILLGRGRQQSPVITSTPIKVQQRKVPNVQPVAVDALRATATRGPVMEYASVPITVDPSECENLLRASCSDESSCSQAGQDTVASTAVHRYVHEHIHHHYHHFETTGELL